MKEHQMEHLLKDYVGKNICVTYIIPNDTLRETSGVLHSFDKEVITMELYDNFGGKDVYHLNRNACQIVSIINIGAK